VVFSLSLRVLGGVDGGNGEWGGMVGETGGGIDGGSAVMRHCGTVVVDWRGGGRRGTERGVGG
jgi:hypothetical protein